MSWNRAGIEPVVARLDGGFIVCGGQAISYWAARYGLGVTVSRDLDLIGSRQQAPAVARLLAGRLHYPHSYDMTVLAAVIEGTWDGRSLLVEILHNVPGLETDASEISVELQPYEDLRILHPIALCIAKLHAVRHFDQTGRTDADHLRIALEASRHWLEELLPVDSRPGLLHLNRWFRTLRADSNRKALARLGLSWRSPVPLSLLEATAAREPMVRAFLERHWPRVLAAYSDPE